MPKSNRCSSTPKYPRVETIQEQELEGENKQVYGNPLKQNYIQERKKKLCSSGSPGDRQERGRQGRKVQENT